MKNLYYLTPLLVIVLAGCKSSGLDLPTDNGNFLTNNWTSIVAAGWTLDQFLKIISKLTPTKLDDNLSDMLGNFLAKFFPPAK